jgi:peptidoglycan/LPS O-acetylase OafA/YrhL
LLNHAGAPGFSGGFVGVDIFFAISGYLIGGLLTQEVARTGTVDLLTFYARRMRRLAPAALVLLLFVMAAGAWLYSPLEHGELYSSVRAAALYLANFWFASRATDYFAGHADANPLLHLWSLAVEEQFYLLLPALIWGLARCRWRSPMAHGRLAALLVVVTLAMCVWTTAHNQPLAFFGMPWRIWEFALGWLVYLSRDRVSHLASASLAGVGLVSWAALTLVVLFFHDRLLFPGAWALLPVLATLGLLVVAGDARPNLACRLLHARGLQWLGNCSYSLYLWHWPLLLFVLQLWPNSGGGGAALALALSLLLGHASYRWIELPGRHRWLPGLPPMRVIALGLLSCVLVAVLASVMAKLFSSPHSAVLQQARTERALAQQQGCHADFHVVDLPDCRFGDPRGQRRVVLFGDSHALQWFPAFEQIAAARGWQLISLTKSGCSALDVPVWLHAYRREYHECKEWRQRTLQRIRVTSPDLIILATATGLEYSVQTWAAALRARLLDWQAQGQAVVVMRDTPKLSFDVPGCLARAHWRGVDVSQACSYPAQDARVWRQDVAQAEASVLAQMGVPRLDVSKVLCGGDPCATEQQGRAVFSDDSHLTVHHAGRLAAALDAELAILSRSPGGQALQYLLQPQP